MGSNWGRLYLSIHTPDDLINAVSESDNGRTVNYLELLEAEGEQVLDMVGSGKFNLPLWERNLYPYIQPGRIARIYIYSELAAASLEVAAFIVKNVDVEDKGGKEPKVVIRGPDLLEETKRRKVKQSVIGEKTTGTIVQIGGAVDLDSGASDVDDFYNGAVIQSGSTGAVIEDYNGSIRRCTLTSDGWSAGTPSASDPYTIYNGKASDDLDQIIGWAPTGWSVSQSGTTDGTTMVLANESVYDALRKTAQQSGEHFSLTDLYPPTRAITWFTNAGITGPVTLDQVTETTRSQFAGDITMAPILEMERTWDEMGAMTRAYVTGGSGNNKITLYSLTAGDVTIPSGWTVDFDASLIINTPAESGLHSSQIVEESVNLTHIHPETDSDESRKLAKIELFNAAVTTMQGAAPTEVEYKAVVVSQKEIRPGHKLYTTYLKTDPVGEVLWDVDQYLYVHRVKNYVNKATKGARHTRLVLKESMYTPQMGSGGEAGSDPAFAILSSHDDALAHGTGWAGDAYLALGGGSVGSIDSGEFVMRDGSRSITGNLPVDGGITIDGVDLSADIVLRDGSKSVTGNLAVDGGVTIDGVDLSVHAADTEAHHDLVTVGTHISLSGQLVDVIVTSDGDTDKGLVLKTDTNGRLRVDGLGINTPTTGSGLELLGDIDMTGDIDIDGDINFTGAQEITTVGSGNLTLNPVGDVDVNAHLEFQGAQSIKTSTGDLTLNPTGDVIVNATGNNIHLVAATDIGGQGYLPAGASGFTTQWKIDTSNTEGEGTLYISNVVADSLIVQMFQAEMTIATTSGLLVTKSVGVVHETFQVPAIAGNVAIIIKDNPVVGTAGVFEDNDKVVFRAFERDSGLTVGWVGGYVTGYSDNGDGTQDWTFYRQDTTAGLATLDIQMGSVIIDYGVTGQGWWEVDGSRDTGPMTRIGTWAGANPWDVGNRTTHIMTGNLNSITSQGDYGFYAAVGSPAGPRIVISDREASFHQIPISLYSGTPDGGQILLYSLKLNSDVESTVFPNGDLTGENVTKNGTPVVAEYFEYINDWTDSANYIQNTASKSGHRWFNMTDISHTLTTLEVVIYATKSAFVDDTCQLRAQMFKSDGTTELTDEVKVFSEKSTSDSQVTIQFTGVDTTALDGEWSAARLKLSWVYHVGGGDEVIKLEPNMEVGPYIAVGYPLPTDYDTTGIGFWVGKDPADDAYKMRIGEAGGAALLWDGTTDAEELIIRDGDGNAVITFQEDGDSFFSGVMNIATAGEIQQGTGAVGVDFTGFRLYNSSNYGMFSTYDSDSEIVRVDGVDGIKVFISDAWVENEAYTFHSVSGGNVGGMYGSYQPVVQYNIVRILSRTNTSGYTASVSLQGYGPSSGDGVVFMRADSDDGSGTDVELTVKSVYSGVDYINMAGADVNIEEGLSVGASAGQAVDEGQLILNQGTGDGDIIRLISSDVAHGMTTNKPTNVYGSFSKAISDDGGLSIYGWSESEYGSILYGMAGTSDTSESTSSKAAVCAMSYKKTGTTVGAFDADDNIFIARNATTTQFIIKGDGEVYSNYATAMTAFPDAEDDMALISTVADTLSGSILKTEWDDFVTYNRDDLARLDIVTKTGFVNTHNITKLFIGAFRQLNGRIAELEAQIGKTN